MKVGRNDPCPCGSGKKYKKCCLAKDEERKASQAQPEAPPVDAPPLPISQAPRSRPTAPFVPPPPSPRLPEREKTPMDIRWEEFEKSDYEGRIALFLETLNDPNLMDEEMAFGMISTLQPQTLQHGQRGRLVEMIRALQDRLPQVFNEKPAYYLSLLLDEAVAAGQRDEVRRLGMELAAQAGNEIDQFNRVVEELAYHGQLGLLVDMRRLAWPDVEQSSDIVPWAIEEFASDLAILEIFNHLDQHPATAEIPPDLWERIRFALNEPYEEGLNRYWQLVSGLEQRSWELKDFQMKPARQRRRDWDEDEEEEENDKDEDPGRRNLNDLLTSFLGYLRREEQVPFTRGNLAVSELRSYFQKRFDGELEPQPPLFSGRRQQRQPKPAKPFHPLCPDRATLDRYLADLLDFLSCRYHTVAAVMEVIPAWLRFLQARALLTRDQHQTVRQQLEPLVSTLLGLYANFTQDPSLLPRLQAAWKPAAVSQAPATSSGGSGGS